MVREVSSARVAATFLDDAIQLQAGDVAATSGVVARPTSEKPFPFLRLPAEVRNMVYQACWGIPDPWRPGDVRTRVCLHQPRITMVNRQIRCESLPMFYKNHDFCFDLTFLWDRPHDAENGRSLLSPFADMIRAFAPTPSRTLEASNLRFLSHLKVEVHRLERLGDAIKLVGFIMSSKDEGDEWDMVMDTAGLDWSDEHRVRQAYIDGFEYGFSIGYHTDLKMDPPTVAAFDEIICLMCLLGTHCPQLTRRVSALVIYEYGGEPIGFKIPAYHEA